MTSTRPDPVIRTKRQSLRRDPNSVVASAALMTGPSRSKAKIEPTDWHKLAWSFYDDVGELRAAVSWKANALSRVNLVAAVVPTVQGDEPTFIDQTIPLSPVAKRALELTEQIAGGPSGQGQLLAALTRQIEVAGVAYYLAVADPITDTFTGTWRALSADEVRRQGGRDQVADPESGEWEDLQESDLLVKVWRAHPRRAWEPDSPVRGCLGSLAEIRLLSQRIAADARSRLTGAGLLLVDNKIEFAPGQGQSGAPEDADDFVQTLMDIASIAPSDPEGPSANVPLVAKLPGDSVDKVQLIKFWSELSAHADELRTAAVRRFALGMDMPPDILLGLGDANHWSGWLITEEAIGMHVEPLAETLAHGFTVGFLKPALKAEGFTQAEVDTVMVWYDASDLSTRPDLSTAAGEAHGKRLISDDAYLGYLGLDAGDRPAEDELRRAHASSSHHSNALPLRHCLGYSGYGHPGLTPTLSDHYPTPHGGLRRARIDGQNGQLHAMSRLAMLAPGANLAR